MVSPSPPRTLLLNLRLGDALSSNAPPPPVDAYSDLPFAEQPMANLQLNNQVKKFSINLDLMVSSYDKGRPDDDSKTIDSCIEHYGPMQPTHFERGDGRLRKSERQQPLSDSRHAVRKLQARAQSKVLGRLADVSTGCVHCHALLLLIIRLDSKRKAHFFLRPPRRDLVAALQSKAGQRAQPDLARLLANASAEVTPLCFPLFLSPNTEQRMKNPAPHLLFLSDPSPRPKSVRTVCKQFAPWEATGAPKNSAFKQDFVAETFKGHSSAELAVASANAGLPVKYAQQVCCLRARARVVSCVCVCVCVCMCA